MRVRESCLKMGWGMESESGSRACLGEKSAGLRCNTTATTGKLLFNRLAARIGKYQPYALPFQTTDQQFGALDERRRGGGRSRGAGFGRRFFPDGGGHGCELWVGFGNRETARGRHRPSAGMPRVC